MGYKDPESAPNTLGAMAALRAKVFVSNNGTSAWRFQTEGTREEVLTWLAYTQHDKESYSAACVFPGQTSGLDRSNPNDLAQIIGNAGGQLALGDYWPEVLLRATARASGKAITTAVSGKKEVQSGFLEDLWKRLRERLVKGTADAVYSLVAGLFKKGASVAVIIGAISYAYPDLSSAILEILAIACRWSQYYATNAASLVAQIPEPPSALAVGVDFVGAFPTPTAEDVTVDLDKFQKSSNNLKDFFGDELIRKSFLKHVNQIPTFNKDTIQNGEFGFWVCAFLIGDFYRTTKNQEILKHAQILKDQIGEFEIKLDSTDGFASDSSSDSVQTTHLDWVNPFVNGLANVVERAKTLCYESKMIPEEVVSVPAYTDKFQPALFVLLSSKKDGLILAETTVDEKFNYKLPTTRSDKALLLCAEEMKPKKCPVPNVGIELDVNILQGTVSIVRFTRKLGIKSGSSNSTAGSAEPKTKKARASSASETDPDSDANPTQSAPKKPGGLPLLDKDQQEDVKKILDMTQNVTTEDNVKRTFTEIIRTINEDIQKAKSEAACDLLERRLQQFDAVFLTVTAGMAKLIVNGVDERHFKAHRINITAVKDAIRPVRASIKVKRAAIRKDLIGQISRLTKEAKDEEELNELLEKEMKNLNQQASVKNDALEDTLGNAAKVSKILAALKEQLNAKETELVKATNENTAKQEALENADNRVKDLESNMATFKEKLNGDVESRKELKASHAAEKQNLKQTITNKKKELNAAKAELTKKRSDGRKAALLVKAIESSNEALRKEINQLNDDANSLQTKAADLEAELEQVKQNRDEIEARDFDLRAEILELLLEKSNLETTIETLNAKVGTGTAKLDEAKQLVSDLQLDNDTYFEINRDLREDIEKLRDANQNLLDAYGLA